MGGYLLSPSTKSSQVKSPKHLPPSYPHPSISKFFITPSSSLLQPSFQGPANLNPISPSNTPPGKHTRIHTLPWQVTYQVAYLHTPCNPLPAHSIDIYKDSKCVECTIPTYYQSIIYAFTTQHPYLVFISESFLSAKTTPHYTTLTLHYF